MSEFIRDDEGNLVNPPTLPEFEQRITAAQNAADQDELERVQAEYHDAREQYVKDREDREDEDGDSFDWEDDQTPAETANEQQRSVPPTPGDGDRSLPPNSNDPQNSGQQPGGDNR